MIVLISRIDFSMISNILIFCIKNIFMNIRNLKVSGNVINNSKH